MAPFNVAVIHGGPGAGGEMAPVARELASRGGVLEPLQTAATLEGQVDELRAVLETQADLPVTLIGFSWGAWLSFIMAARYPTLVKKLILVGSGPFEENYAAGILTTRLGRLNNKERTEAESVLARLAQPAKENLKTALARLGALCVKADAFDPIPNDSGETVAVEPNPEIFNSVWPEAAELRRTGKLLALGKEIHCPVVAIHGDYDPHPAEGVAKPLSGVLRNFRWTLLKNCGHMPWREKRARDRFFEILREEVG